MTKTVVAKGHCVCGAVHLTAQAVSSKAGACHCDTCRRWGGGPLMAVDCGTDVDFEGVETLTVYDSSEWAERGFCGGCGTHLYYRLKASGQFIVPVGLLDSEARCEFDHQVFIDRKPGYYDFANTTNNMTGEELFALFAGETPE